MMMVVEVCNWCSVAIDKKWSVALCQSGSADEANGSVSLGIPG